MIDLLLENAVQPSSRGQNFGDLVGCTDCVAFPEAPMVQVHLKNKAKCPYQIFMGIFQVIAGISNLQSYLDAFVEMVDSTYGCVMFQGGVVTATKNWFYLHPDETMLLSLYLQVMPSSELM